MKQWVGIIVFIASAVTAVLADDKKGPEIQIIDDKVSIQAQDVGLGRLLRLFDMATGLKSKVPPELANRNVSVRFSGLTFDQAVEKIFEGVPLDYVVIRGQGIVVTSPSQQGNATATASAPSNSNNPSPAQQMQSEDQPFFAPGGMVGQPQQFPGVPSGNVMPGQTGQPAMIQTPFGPMPNPRAAQGMQGNAPMAMPGANHQPFGLANPAANPATSPFGDGSIPTFNPNPVTPTAPPVQNPFGMPNGMGTPFPVQQGPAPIRKPPGQ